MCILCRSYLWVLPTVNAPHQHQDSQVLSPRQLWFAVCCCLLVCDGLKPGFQTPCRKYQHDDAPAGTQLPEGELHWTRRTTILYPVLCSTAGLIAGLFGIGGGTGTNC